jgi:hypothetical protein
VLAQVITPHTAEVTDPSYLTVFFSAAPAGTASWFLKYSIPDAASKSSAFLLSQRKSSLPEFYRQGAL